MNFEKPTDTLLSSTVEHVARTITVELGVPSIVLILWVWLLIWAYRSIARGAGG